ncbi:hypothetical protein JCM6882_007862 [Rhodosporidiobolus microsporus]
MLVGHVGCLLCLIGVCATIAINAENPSYNVQVAAVAFVYLHLAFYGGCIDASSYVYGSEIWPNHLRGKGVGISVAGLFAGSLILLCAAPTAFAWKLYLVCAVMTIIAIITLWLYFPEVNGNPLELVAAKFGDSVEMDQLPDPTIAAEHNVAHSSDEEAGKEKRAGQAAVVPAH